MDTNGESSLLGEVGLVVDSVVLSSGDVLPIEPGQMVVVVGPNNAGKSALLREIRGALAGRHAHARRVTTNCEARRVGSLESLWQWLEMREKNEHDRDPGHSERVYGANGEIELYNVRTWEKAPSRELIHYVTELITADDRLELTNPAKNIDLLGGKASHPFHHLVRSASMHRQVDKCVQQAFGMRLLFDRNSGELLPAYCVPAQVSPPVSNEASPEYAHWLRSHDALHLQGHGLRSFVGCMAQLTTKKSFVTLVDEPEVFLHPPQARQLGVALVQEKPRHQQCIIATHSAHVLRGVLGASHSLPKVVRITRSHGVNRIRIVSPDLVENLAKEPLLRYSNAIEALFHEYAVLCESDADCRFYQWILEAADEEFERNGLFIPTGGKQRMPTLRRILGSLGIPCVLVCDIDLLRDKGELRAVCEAAGAEWDRIAEDWAQLNSDLASHTTAARVETAQAKIKSAFKEWDEPVVGKRLESRVREAVQVKSGWDALKRGGVASLAQGRQTELATKLIEYLKGFGVYLVPVGELERFAREVGQKGGRWLVDVMSRYDPGSVELTEARTFVLEFSSALRTEEARAESETRDAPFVSSDSPFPEYLREKAPPKPSFFRDFLSGFGWIFGGMMGLLTFSVLVSLIVKQCGPQAQEQSSQKPIPAPSQ